MDLNLLTTFEAVARTGGFSTAARELRMPKSSVSRGVARLEADLGTQLLFRTTRQVKLTEAGTALYDRLTPLLSSVRTALSEVPVLQEQPTGTLRITAPADLADLVLAEAVTRYTARYPAVAVELHLTGRVVDLVAEGFDVALRVASKLEDSSLVVRKVATLTFQLFASPRYLARRGTPRHDADLEGHDWVVFRSGPQKLRAGPGKGAPPGSAGRIVCDDLLFARDAIRFGGGLGYLPSFMAEPDVVAGTLVRVLPRLDRPAGSLHLVTPAARHVPAKVAAFRDLVAELLRGRTGAA
jgi:DNA-binding transcriptional LysR family regulator